MEKNYLNFWLNGLICNARNYFSENKNLNWKFKFNSFWYLIKYKRIVLFRVTKCFWKLQLLNKGQNKRYDTLFQQLIYLLSNSS